MKQELILKLVEMLIGSEPEQPSDTTKNDCAAQFIGNKVIIRTYSAGVWFGTLTQKDGKEVILNNARRMWRWWAAESISLSAVSIHGINQDKSKICEAVKSIWLEAIEIIPCTKNAIISIEEAKNVESQ